MIQEHVYTMPFASLPAFTFTGNEAVVYASNDLRVSWLAVGQYVVYKLDYLLLPNHLPHGFTWLVFNTHALQKKQQKVFYLYNSKQQSISLGQGTYDIGLLFSGGRVYADKHFFQHFAQGQ